MIRFDPQAVLLNEGKTVEAILTPSGLHDPEKQPNFLGELDRLNSS